MAAISFPDGFQWGTATAAHQIEGGNVNNDWWEFEHDPTSGCLDRSGDACDSYHRYPEDIALVAEFGFSFYRFSVEWSRIEPEEGEFSRAALDHYRRMLATCREQGLVPMITYHHFTHPRWLAAAGTWEAPHAVDRFARYCERVTAHLGDLIGMAGTINEPNVVATMGWRHGIFPPRVRDRDRRAKVNDALVAAHRAGVEAIRSGPGDFPVGLTLSMTDYQAQPGGEEWVERIRRPSEDVYLEATGGDDFIGVQTYTRARFGPDGGLGPEPGVPTTQMGYEFYPEALEGTIRRAWLKTGGLPVLVTENGIGTDDDEARIDYVTRALAGVRRCLDDGIDVRGYMYWSLLDNFEWVLGYGPTFGLVAVDRETFVRRPKPSAAWLGGVATKNGL
ncbi:MAG TPA: family 1 glycosylhydrolase [Acidimicrobiales bacterium]|jgi:beta-glucosidase|nr:family 1 glycosylhydrolase [Acidimicrobiales bacterium]